MLAKFWEMTRQSRMSGQLRIFRCDHQFERGLGLALDFPELVFVDCGIASAFAAGPQ
jgi:hypothetical protein